MLNFYFNKKSFKFSEILIRFSYDRESNPAFLRFTILRFTIYFLRFTSDSFSDYCFPKLFK